MSLDMKASLHLIILNLSVWLLSHGSLLFSNETERGGLDGKGCGGGELGGVKGGETVIRIDHMRKEPVFNKKGTIKKCPYIRQSRMLVKMCPKK